MANWNMHEQRSRFWLALLFELALLVLAVVLMLVWKRPVLADIHWSAPDVMAGIAVAVPLWALFLLTMRSSRGPLAPIREFLETWARPFFDGWTLSELAILSLMAGVSEEMLFRGAIQGTLAPTLGQPVAIALAGVAFGLCHWVTWTYAVVATGIGVLFSVLWIATGNLLTPIVTHGIYDFVALAWFLRGQKSA